MKGWGLPKGFLIIPFCGYQYMPLGVCLSHESLYSSSVPRLHLISSGNPSLDLTERSQHTKMTTGLFPCVWHSPDTALTISLIISFFPLPTLQGPYPWRLVAGGVLQSAQALKAELGEPELCPYYLDDVGYVMSTL